MLIYIEIFLIASIAWLIKLKLEHSNILDSSIDFQNGDCSSFTLIYGNLSSASTIFLGELHERTQETYDCIEQLTKRNILHTVYMEGIQSGIEAHCNSMISKDAPASRLASKPNRACIGWDFPEATKAIIKLSEENYRFLASQPALRQQQFFHFENLCLKILKCLFWDKRHHPQKL